MQDVLKDLFKESVYWQETKHPRFFYAIRDTRHMLLRLNNFPEEPLYTFIKGLEILDLEELPETWIVPF